VTKVLECALETHSSTFNTKAHKIVVELNKIYGNNVVTQCGYKLFNQKDGIINDDNHCVSLGNIAVHYITSYTADFWRAK